MKTEKISNSLLSFVMGCECEFKEIIESNPLEKVIIFKHKRNPTSTGVYIGREFINLDTFIRRSLKKFSKNFCISTENEGITIYKIENGIATPVFRSEPEDLSDCFSIECDIECLEWVNDQIKEG
jgi:hypothetical protein